MRPTAGRRRHTLPAGETHAGPPKPTAWTPTAHSSRRRDADGTS